MKTTDIKAIQLLLKSPKKIVIISHRNPDGDAMGSTLALFHFLSQLHHEVTPMIPNEIPDFLTWLPGYEQVLIYEKNSKTATQAIKQADILFTVDFNVLHRIGDMEQVLKEFSGSTIMIDHHQNPDNYALYSYSDVTFGSTCEMVYHFIDYLGHKELINKTIATCLYTGMVTDSGSFKFSTTTSNTHRIVADLLDKGIHHSDIHTLLFDNKSYDSVQLLGKALQNLVLLPPYHASYSTLSQKELNAFDISKGNTDGIVNYGLSIKNIIFTALFIENKDDGIIKISFRSQGDFDVNQFARTYFEGGGHINAAGGKSYLTLDETVNKFITILSKINESN